MHGTKQASKQAQRGVSLSGLIVVLIVIAAIAMLGIKVFPTFIEYRAVKSAIASAKTSSGQGTIREIQNAFDKSADINSIDSITGKDLIITKDTGDTQIAFDYDKQIPLFTDVTLMIHYSGTTDKSGKIPERAPATPQ